MSDGVLLTGGTGFLGMSLLARLLADDGPPIWFAVRARDEQQARERVEQTLAQLYEHPPAGADRIRPLVSDLTTDGLGIDGRTRRVLAREIGRVVHSAASVAFTLPLEDARAINLDGTRRMLELARELPQLERFVHVSTAYVAGRREGMFRETDGGGEDFRNTYERSKREAELVVDDTTDVPSVIVRPSIVVGEAGSGWTAAFNVLYWPLQAFARGLLSEVPADPDGIVDMVPVDYVAELLKRALFAPEVGRRLHAVAGERAIRVGDLVELVSSELGRPAPRFVPTGTLEEDDPLNVFAPYFDVGMSFGDAGARALMGDREPPRPAEYMDRLLAFAQAARWGKNPISRERAALAYAA